MEFEKLEISDIQNGYAPMENGRGQTCLTCGETFKEGQVYPIAGGYYLPEAAARLHVHTRHPDYLDNLLQSDSKYNTLTGNQRELLALFAAGEADKDVAAKLGISVSTVRQQKFQFREKAKAARYYLALYQSVFGKGVAIMPVHEHARMVDDRYVITDAEREKILGQVFSSQQPLRLKYFSRKEKKKLVALAKIAQQFQPGQVYTEREVNDVLKEIYDDYVTLRRYLIEYGFMQRNTNGSEYKLT